MTGSHKQNLNRPVHASECTASARDVNTNNNSERKSRRKRPERQIYVAPGLRQSRQIVAGDLNAKINDKPASLKLNLQPKRPDVTPRRNNVDVTPRRNNHVFTYRRNNDVVTHPRNNNNSDVTLDEKQVQRKSQGHEHVSQHDVTSAHRGNRSDQPSSSDRSSPVSWGDLVELDDEVDFDMSLHFVDDDDFTPPVTSPRVSHVEPEVAAGTGTMRFGRGRARKPRRRDVEPLVGNASVATPEPNDLPRVGTQSHKRTPRNLHSKVFRFQGDVRQR